MTKRCLILVVRTYNIVAFTHAQYEWNNVEST